MAIEVVAQTRKLQGTGASRRLRRTGKVPGILYGGKKPAVTIELDHNPLYHQLRNERFHASILTLTLDGAKEQVLLRAVNMHPFKTEVQHIDFQRVSEDEKVHMKVPLHFINAEKSPAIKEQGGLITHVLNEMDIRCLPADLPEFIQVDLSQLAVGHSIHVRDLPLPKGVELALGGNENPKRRSDSRCPPGRAPRPWAAGIRPSLRRRSRRRRSQRKRKPPLPPLLRGSRERSHPLRRRSLPPPTCRPSSKKRRNPLLPPRRTRAAKAARARRATGATRNSHPRRLGEGRGDPRALFVHAFHKTDRRPRQPGKKARERPAQRRLLVRVAPRVRAARRAQDRGQVPWAGRQAGAACRRAVAPAAADLHEPVGQVGRRAFPLLQDPAGRSARRAR